MSRNSAHRDFKILPASFSGAEGWHQQSSLPSLSGLSGQEPHSLDPVLQLGQGPPSECGHGPIPALLPSSKTRLLQLLKTSGSCMWLVLPLKRGVAGCVINISSGEAVCRQSGPRAALQPEDTL